MNSKISHQISKDHTTRAKKFVNPLWIWLRSLRDFVTRLGPLGRGLTMLLILLLVAVASVAQLFPLRVTPLSASAGQFSGERAKAILPIIAREPHPQGSPAQARLRDFLVGQLTDMGLEVEVQASYGLENVVARLRGTDPTGAIVILAHYDTVSYSNGAGDNGRRGRRAGRDHAQPRRRSCASQRRHRSIR